eukprot:CAMPEP_0202689718 /NCGR_PEP_ID=MMETSP1385-20130828/4914_1 /ASSEMBLY_ACC=CAM_ASM_000861 /TAXON_ID=933848 /ORGANISM="Elphidium margaritaceum" /LENGTH=570 /DNA_ID=CAMNT_0049344895 /DNA_START=181 /DNA_END=1893 /DNA_ORIENTATION=+
MKNFFNDPVKIITLSVIVLTSIAVITGVMFKRSIFKSQNSSTSNSNSNSDSCKEGSSNTSNSSSDTNSGGTQNRNAPPPHETPNHCTPITPDGHADAIANAPKKLTYYRSADSALRYQKHQCSNPMIIPTKASAEVDETDYKRNVLTRTRVTETRISRGDGDTHPIVITETVTEEVSLPPNANVNIHLSEKNWSPFNEGLRFAVLEDQGKRTHMENSTSIVDMSASADAAAAAAHVCESLKKYSFSLFDGHLGNEAAKFCTQHLHQYVARYLDDAQPVDCDATAAGDDLVAAAIRKAFHTTDEQFKKYAYEHQCEAGAVGVYVYYKYDVRTKDHYIYIANVGDCRAILCHEGSVMELSKDHNAKNVKEQQRCGQYLYGDLLSNAISVTRAIGDYCSVATPTPTTTTTKTIPETTQVAEEESSESSDEGKQYACYAHKKLDGLSCDPYICRHQIDDKDEFLIIACDGLWDVVSNKDAMQTCRRSLRSDGDCQKAAEKLLNYAKAQSNRGSLGMASHENEQISTSDNISVMVIGFANKDSNGQLHIGPKLPPRPKGMSRLRRFQFSSKKKSI